MTDEALPAQTLVGRGLALRPIDPDRDAPALHAVFGDEKQLELMLRPPCASVADTAALLHDWNRDTSSPQWSVVDDDVVLGRITLVKHRAGVFEVGVQVVPRAQGRGIATRAIIVATTHGFEHLEACRIYADIDPNNIPCVRAFRRAGFRFEGTLLANWKTPRGIFDSDIYAATVGWTAPN